MADSNQIITEIILDLDKLRQQSNQAEKIGSDAAKRAGSSMGEGIEKGFGNAFSRFKRELLGIGAVLAGAFAFRKIIAEATQAEDALNSFNSALRVAGNFSVQASERFRDFANSLQRVTTVGDDTIIKGGALLASLGKLKGEGLEKATKAALDLAAGMNMDVNTAFDLVAKAATGNTAVLGRYGVRVKATGDAARDFAATLSQINATFGGLSESKVNTFSGALAQMNNNFTDVLQALGEMIIKSPAVVAIIKFLSAKFAELATALTQFAKRGDFDTLVRDVVSFGQGLVTFVVAPMELMFNVARMAFDGIVALVQGAVALIANAVAKVTGVLAPYSEAAASVNQQAQIMAEATGKAWEDAAMKSEDSMNRVFQFNVADAASGYMAQLQQVVENAKPVSMEAGNTIKAGVESGVQGVSFDSVVTAMHDMKNKVQVTATEIAKTVNSSIVGGLGSAFQSMGAALATGKNAWAEFGKSILKTLGQLLVTFGQMLIAVGIGLASVPLLFGLSGPAAIAAGVAATVLGGAMMALGGGGSGGPQASGSPSGGANEAGPATNFENGFPVVGETKPQTQVQVVVQGNVLDRRETGLALVEVIQEHFDTNGSVLVGAT